MNLKHVPLLHWSTLSVLKELAGGFIFPARISFNSWSLQEEGLCVLSHRAWSKPNKKQNKTKQPQWLLYNEVFNGKNNRVRNKDSRRDANAWKAHIKLPCAVESISLTCRDRKAFNWSQSHRPCLSKQV